MAERKVRLCLHCNKPLPREKRNYCCVACQVWSRTAIGSPEDCWLWTGAKTEGYGVIKVGGRNGPVLRTHRLAWEIFNGREMSDGMFACHHCDVRSCNNPSHIFEGTAKANTQDMMNKGRNRTTPQIGEDNESAKLSEEDVISILSDNRSQRVIAAEYGVTQTAIYAVKSKKTWKHIGIENSTVPSDRTREAYRRSHLSPLTDDQVRSIRMDKRSARKIGADYGVGRQSIWSIKQGKTFKHLK